MEAIKKFFSSLTKHAEAAEKAIIWLNFKRAILMVLVSVLGVSTFTIWEQRSSIVERLAEPQLENAAKPREVKFKVSPDIQDKIKGLVDRNPLIVGISVISADIRINQKTRVFNYADNPILLSAWEKHALERGVIQPIFTKDEVNNIQMVSVINGEFSCSKSSDVSPVLIKISPAVCRISLPPYYGEFAGYIAFALGNVPSPEEANEIRIDAVRLSTEIFFKNIARTR